MLEGLNTIDWQNLTHAYGRANNIPELVRLLMSPVPEVSKQAIENLFGSIWHQEVLYEATPFVIPFLIELLAKATVQCKKQILSYLADLAMRCSHDDTALVIDNEDEDPWQGDREYRQEQMLHQQVLCKDIYTRIAQGRKIYLNLLANDHPEIRVLVPYMLDILEEYTEEVITSVQLHLLEERDSQVKASILIYLGFQTEYSHEYEQILRAFVNNEHENILVRIFASLSQLKHMKENMPREALYILLEALMPSQEMEETYRALPWSSRLGRSIVSVVTISLQSLDYEHNDLFIPKLLEALAHFDKNYPLHGSANALAAFNIVHALLKFSFCDKGIPVNKIPFFLTNTQRDVLMAILTSPSVVDLNHDIAELMENLGFPYPWKMRFLLAID